MQSYSQFGEDLVIRRLVEHLATGRLLDVGAFHPITFSNTRGLLEAGWEGVLIEPSPEPLLTLIREYHNWPTVKVVNALVDTEPGIREMHVTADALSTTSPKVLQTWQKVGGYYGRQWIASWTPAQVLDAFGAFDFINVDTEGSSVPVFESFLNAGARPKCFCVEYDDLYDHAVRVAGRHGYRVAESNGTNVIFTL